MPGRASWRALSDVPARIERTGVPAWTRSGATSSRTFGLTARTTRSDLSASARLPSTASPPTSSASAAALEGSASANSIASGAPGSPRAAAHPRASPPAMFPAPTNPSLMGGNSIRRSSLALVEEAALEQAGLLLGRDLDVLGREQEDPLRDPLHTAAERVGHAGGEVDQPLRELAVGRLEVDDHRLVPLELVGYLLGVVEAPWSDDVHRGDTAAVSAGRAAPATPRGRFLHRVVHLAYPAATRSGLLVAEDVVDVVVAGAAARSAPNGLPRRYGRVVERQVRARVALVVLALLDVVALDEAEVLERASPCVSDRHLGSDSA